MSPSTGACDCGAALARSPAAVRQAAVSASERGATGPAMQAVVQSVSRAPVHRRSPAFSGACGSYGVTSVRSTPAAHGPIPSTSRPEFRVDVSFLVVVVIVTALAFDFTNGFHDTANAMATSIATGALKPKVAVAHLRGAEPGRRVPVDRGRQDDLRRHLSTTAKVTPGDHLRRPGRRDPLEPGHLAARPAVVVVARAVRRPDRRGVGRPSGRGAVHFDKVVSKISCPGRRRRRSSAASSPRWSHLLRLHDHPAGRRARRTGRASGTARRSRPRWSRSRTAPATRRRRWASSPWS